MNRAEAIKQVAENYASQMCKNCSARLYCEEKNKKCVECREQENVYVDGAKWADNNPDLSSLWHDIKEEPKMYEYILFEYISNKNELKYFAVYVTKNTYGILQELGERCHWAYISDLSPKGGGE